MCEKGEGLRVSGSAPWRLARLDWLFLLMTRVHELDLCLPSFLLTAWRGLARRGVLLRWQAVWSAAAAVGGGVAVGGSV